MDEQDIKLSSLIQLYLMYGEDRNFSPKTVRWYSDMLRRFSEALGPEATIKDIDDAIRTTCAACVSTRGWRLLLAEGRFPA